MPVIHITQKLQKELGLKQADLSAIAEQSGPFVEWYAHLFFMDGKKYIIFVEVETLFSFSVENVFRKDIRERLPEFFEKGLGQALYIEGVTKEGINKIMDVCRGDIVFAKAENHRTIGAMNEFIKQHKYRFFYQGRPIDARDRFNRFTPMRGFPGGSKKYEFPIDVFANTLKNLWGIEFTPEKESFFQKQVQL
ncbi:MAG: hypothetical protein COW28_02315 [bacterium (Candidatus Ratteibacteria) CG15_BIG_FIL_POST_REV_8_21_14_020_41_12]|uniref:DUF6933 domain-containing protein n=1 Tax=bacterium (Candidatus Ratteibacteria) CG15_BIG_FIL_POST_REV_8_21_14_020_41_12 TaxID=2014291 RepID=A0A2M7GZG7_9BACT|nr:MAG: hypothetical protein COW28_02315 [bacterium (Candidatus Ratteibacteria) CG15_BIG_FIL_POST_REV_8_21_14_020_41_12]